MSGKQLASVVVLAVVLFGSAEVAAQTGNSGIAGVVKDASGAILPGVAVEAASPALIEKVRTVVTDVDGSYRILDLRPGLYSITFSLPGFSTVKREGIQLPPAFTATINAELVVGAIAETITVSGAAPLVDVQNATSQRVLPAEVLDTLPASRSPQGFTALMPGIISQGLSTIQGSRNEQNTSVHGSPTGESVYALDGINTASTNGPGGSSSNTRMPQAYVAEINIITGGGTAEQQLSGSVTNVIPKEGGNNLSGSEYFTYSTARLAQSNLTPELRAMGFQANGLQGVRKLWDFEPALGGRIFRDKLWFFASYRNSGSILTRAGVFDNLTPRGWTYTPDYSHPALNKLTTGSENLRLTWQVTPKHKIAVFSDFEPINTYNHGFETPISPEVNPYTPYRPNAYSTAKWTATLTSRLLFELSALNQSVDNNKRRQTPATCFCSAPPVGVDVISAVESTTGIIIRADSTVGSGGANYMHAARHSIRYAATTSYVTGSHAFKAGLQFVNGRQYQYEEVNGAIAFTLKNGAPISLTEYATPDWYNDVIHQDLGLFIQDQWTHKRLTLNGGVRYDYFNGGASAEHLPAGLYVPARDFPATTHSPLWKDVDPRLAASYDLFGDSKTALKFTVGRFVKGAGATALPNLNPVVRSVLTATRTWDDGNKDYWPDCDLRNPLPNGECGKMNNTNFGQNNPNAITYAPELLNGLRPWNWETSTSVQRELMTGVSVTFGYYYKIFRGLTYNNNVLTSPGDYTQYCITAPVNARLPSGGGNKICGLYDISPALFGQSQVVVKPVDNYAAYNGIDILQSIKMHNGVTLSGGVNIQRTTNNTCAVLDTPGVLRFCDTTPPFQPNATYVGFIPLPWWGLSTSATYRDYPGAVITATYQASNAEIFPSLGRNLASGINGTVNVQLIAPNTVFGKRQRQLDGRISKRFRLRKYRLTGNLDVFNILNVNSAETVNTTYGPNWLRPTALQQGRYVKLSAQFEF